MEKFLQVVGFIETRFGNLFSLKRKTTLDILFAIGLIIIFSIAYATYRYVVYYRDPGLIDWEYIITTNFYYATILALIYLLWTENKSGIYGLTFILAYWLIQEIIYTYLRLKIHSYLFWDPETYFYRGGWVTDDSFRIDNIGVVLRALLPNFFWLLFYFVTLRFFMHLGKSNYLELKVRSIRRLLIAGFILGFAVLVYSHWKDPFII